MPFNISLCRFVRVQLLAIVSVILGLCLVISAAYYRMQLIAINFQLHTIEEYMIPYQLTIGVLIITFAFVYLLIQLGSQAHERVKMKFLFRFLLFSMLILLQIELCCFVFFGDQEHEEVHALAEHCHLRNSDFPVDRECLLLSESYRCCFKHAESSIPDTDEDIYCCFECDVNKTTDCYEKIDSILFQAHQKMTFICVFVSYVLLIYCTLYFWSKVRTGQRHA
ncbi:hypothetical protein ACOME3_004707 [Neoechinorhynchus agilis]